MLIDEEKCNIVCNQLTDVAPNIKTKNMIMCCLIRAIAHIMGRR
jgi:hypothetical protein